MIDPAVLKPAQEVSAAVAALVASVTDAVVSVAAAGGRGSGFAWRPGYIVTAEEALAEDAEVHVTFADGKTLPARVAGRDPTTDIALLQVERSDMATVPPALTTTQAGALVVAVGAERGVAVAALGLVAHVGGRWRSMRGGDIDQRIELDVALRRSGEGGIVVDTTGRPLGMVVFGPRRRALVIPSATIERTAEQLRLHGRIARGYLGLGLQPVRLSGSDGGGAIVISVDPDGPGARSGLHQGDVVVSWDDEPVPPLRVLLRILGPDSVGRKVSLGINRGGKPQLVPLTISERPQA